MTTQLFKIIFTSALGLTLVLGVSFKAQAQFLNGLDRNDLLSANGNGVDVITDLDLNRDVIRGQSDLIGGEIPTVPVQSVSEPSATLALFVLTGTGLLLTRKHLS